jgi:hypothetical protein
LIFFFFKFVPSIFEEKLEIINKYSKSQFLNIYIFATFCINMRVSEFKKLGKFFWFSGFQNGGDFQNG